MYDVYFITFSRIHSSPIPDNSQNRDLLCFVDTYPYGRGGMYDDRVIKIKPAMYLRWILNHENPNPRRNVQFLFSLFNNKDIRALDSGIYASLNSAKLPNMNVKKLREGLCKNDKNLEINLTTSLAAVRNSKEYWDRERSNLYAMDEDLGSSTFFLTLSSNEYTWNRLGQFIKDRNSDIEEINKYSINELIGLDPLSVSFFWEKKFRIFFKNVISNSDNFSPLGNISDYFWRREYQARGAPHIHSKLWVKNAPKIGIDDEDTILAFIDKHITCRIPNEKKEPKLFELVTRFQIHRCTDSCKRTQRKKNGKNDCRIFFS